MTESRMRYAFLTTYDETMFQRRIAPDRFELSPPNRHNDTEPSVRQCFLYLSQLCSIDSLITDPAFYGKELVGSLFNDSTSYATTRRLNAVKPPSSLEPTGGF